MSKDGVYVCADLGVNWCGKFDLLTKMMKTCSWRGVDAVKVQYFDQEYLETNKADYTPELRKRLDKMVLNFSHLYTLSCVAKELEHKVDFIVTPFSAKLAENLKDVPLDGIKIRSKDWLNKEMWDVVKDWNVQRYVSVPYDNNQAMIGKADGPKVAWAMGRRGGGNHRVYCIPKYPPTLEELNLTNVEQHDGFSCHYPDHHIPLIAATIAVNRQVKYGKRRFYLEVHFKMPKIKNSLMPDANVSLNDYGLGDLCRGVKMLEEAIG